MKCEIIRDLLPLYIDNVCSEETEKEVEAHLDSCDACREIYGDMVQNVIKDLPEPAVPEKKIYLGIRQKIGNMLICAILFIAVMGLAFGMIGEIGEHGWPQGIFAIAFFVPCTAFLLSMMNIFFWGTYPSRPWFCWVSGGLAVVLCLIGDLICLVHYQFPPQWPELIPYCGAIALVFGGMAFFVSKLYSRFCIR